MSGIRITVNYHFDMSEAQLQAECFMWTWNTYPHLRRLFFHPHNEGRKTVKKAVMDRSGGVVPGIPDFVFLSPPMGIEFKIPGEKQNEDQKKVEEVWVKAGIPYHVVMSVEQYIDIIDGVYGKKG